MNNHEIKKLQPSNQETEVTESRNGIYVFKIRMQINSEIVTGQAADYVGHYEAGFFGYCWNLLCWIFMGCIIFNLNFYGF